MRSESESFAEEEGRRSAGRTDVASGATDVALANGFLDGERLCVLNRANDGVQRAAHGALEMTNPAVAVAGVLTVLLERGARMTRDPERPLAGRVVVARVAGAHDRKHQACEPCNEQERGGRAPKAPTGPV